MAKGKNGMKNPGQIFQVSIDSITSTPPTIKKGIYTLHGNQMTVMNHLNNVTGTQMMLFQPQQQVYQNPLQVYQPLMIGMTPVQPSKNDTEPVIQATITVVGNKTSPSSSCCFLLTSIIGSFLLFPLLFMCCMWWKKIVFPRYQVSPEFYRSLGRFLRKEMQCRVLNLTVVDNAFDTDKARLLYEALSGTSVTGLNFSNTALPCNYMRNEADDFQGNMMAIKGLPMTSSIKWGDMMF